MLNVLKYGKIIGKYFKGHIKSVNLDRVFKEIEITLFLIKSVKIQSLRCLELNKFHTKS